MKKLLSVLCVICISVISYAEKLPVGLEVDAGYLLQKNDYYNANHFFLEGSALFHAVKNFYVRIRVTDISIYSNDFTTVAFGTGLYSWGIGNGVDVMAFGHSRKFNPYGVGGFTLSAGSEGGAYLGVRLGSGVEFNAKSVFPFVEADLDFHDLSISSLGAQNAVTLKAGIRVK
jgi:hypothetical protein